MLQIPQRAAAGDGRNGSKVVCRWRRTHGPLESPRIPGVVPCFRSLEVRNNKVRHKHESGNSLNECPDTHEKVHRVPTPAGLVGVDSPRHSEHAGNMHHVKRQVKADQEKPEMQLAEAFVEYSSGDFWIPVINCAEEGEQDSAYDHIVKVRDDKIRAAQLPIEGCRAKHYAGEAGN